MDYLLYPIIFLVFPIILLGLTNRTKAIWAGRKGFPILQLGYDLVRLVRKKPVYSASTSLIFQASGVVFFLYNGSRGIRIAYASRTEFDFISV